MSTPALQVWHAPCADMTTSALTAHERLHPGTAATDLETALAVQSHLDLPVHAHQLLERAATLGEHIDRLVRADIAIPALAQIVHWETHITIDGHCDAAEAIHPNTVQDPETMHYRHADAIELALEIETDGAPPRVERWPCDVAFVLHDPEEDWVGNVTPILTEEAAVDPHDLAELLLRAFFHRRDGTAADGVDSVDTQLERARDEATDIAIRAVHGFRAATLDRLRRNTARYLAPHVPAHYTARISVHNLDTNVMLIPPQKPLSDA